MNSFLKRPKLTRLMIRLGITGGIGSGKSYVSHLLAERGMPLYDTDSEAKRITATHPSVRRELRLLLGDDVYDSGGSLNKSLLASYLFASEENARRINSIIHPYVFEDFQRWAEVRRQEGCPLVGMECAILFESGFHHGVDKVAMVYAPVGLRVRRAMERDKATEAQVRARMAVQMDEEEKRLRSDFVLLNDGVSDLAPQLDSLLISLVGRKELV